MRPEFSIPSPVGRDAPSTSVISSTMPLAMCTAATSARDSG
jgi:hypothetical protein